MQCSTRLSQRSRRCPPPRTRMACDRMVLAVCISEGATPSASYTRFPCGKSWVKHLISIVVLFSCANGRHRTGPPVDDGESETGGTLRSHIRPAPQERYRAGRPLQWPVAFGLSKLNRVFLRSHCGAPVPVISMRVRLRQERQPGFASGLNGKEDAAVQHRSAVPGG